MNISVDFHWFPTISSDISDISDISYIYIYIYIYIYRIYRIYRIYQIYRIYRIGRSEVLKKVSRTVRLLDFLKFNPKFKNVHAYHESMEQNFQSRYMITCTLVVRLRTSTFDEKHKKRKLTLFGELSRSSRDSFESESDSNESQDDRLNSSKSGNATFWRIKAIVPGFVRIGIRFERIPGRSA